VASGAAAIGGEQHLDRRHLAGKAGKIAAKFRQGGAVGSLEQRQQRLADNPALIAYAAQQQLLTVLVRRAELHVDEGRYEHEDDRKQYGFGRERPNPSGNAMRTTLDRSSGIQSR